MGFKQISPDQVVDDEGNTYYSPFLNYDPSKVPVLSPPEVQERPDLPPLAALQTPPEVPPNLPSMRGDGAIEVYPNRDYKAAAPEQPSLQQGMKNAKAAADGPRNAAMVGDVAAFSVVGGTAKSDEDMARIMGGQAERKAQTAQAEAAASRIVAEGEIAKSRRVAELTLETADQYDQHVNKIMQESKSRWDDWKKRNDAASKALVDPRHAFSDMSTLSRVGWALAFLGAGLQGGAQVQGVQQAVNKLVDNDIAAQKLNIENRREGLNAEKGALLEQDKIGRDSVADWYAARQLRLTAIGKQLDANIAAMGLPAAQAAGLLKARDAIEAEVIKGQQHVADHYFEQGKDKAKYAHEIYLERLKSQLRMEEDKLKESLKKGDSVDTLPTDTQLGLQMVDRKTGQRVEGGRIPLKVKGEKAVEAGKVLSDANYEASQLRDAKKSLKSMSTTDIARGGTAEFASTVTELIQARAVRYNGHRLTDHDLEVSATEVLGAPVTVNNGVITNMARVIKQVGGTKEGIEKVFDRELRNLSTQTMNRLHPYIDSAAAQKYDIQFNLQDTNVNEPSKEPDDINTAVTKAAGGADTSDLLVPGARPPVVKDVKNPVEAAENLQYSYEKSKGRGKQGGLPVLQSDEESKVAQATAAFEKAPADDIIRLSQAYLRDKKLSEEAKHEIRVEAQQALLKAIATEAKVREEAAGEFREMNKKLDSAEGRSRTYTYPNAFVPGTDTPTPEFEKFLHTDLVDEMRRRAGLEARPR